MPDRYDADEHSPSRGRALVLVTLLVAIAALALSGWTLFRLTQDEPSGGTYTESQRTEAKAKICSAADLVRRGVSLNTNLQPAGGPEDVTGALAVAANARVALYDGGQYLIDRLEPATPQDLADTVRTFANGLMDIGAAATAGAQNTDADQAARLKDADAANAKIMDLCR
jgi:hypothetical protein